MVSGLLLYLQVAESNMLQASPSNVHFTLKSDVKIVG